MPNTEISAEVQEPEPRNRRERRVAASAKATRRWVNVDEVADHPGISVPSVWRGVRDGRLPKPSYPTPQAARWNIDELDAAMGELKALPRDAMAARRAGRIAAAASATPEM